MFGRPVHAQKHQRDAAVLAQVRHGLDAAAGEVQVRHPVRAEHGEGVPAALGRAVDEAVGGERRGRDEEDRLCGEPPRQRVVDLGQVLRHAAEGRRPGPWCPRDMGTGRRPRETAVIKEPALPELTAPWHTPERSTLLETVRAFARDRVKPLADELDPKKGLIPPELLTEMAELGLCRDHGPNGARRPRARRLRVRDGCRGAGPRLDERPGRSSPARRAWAAAWPTRPGARSCCGAALPAPGSVRSHCPSPTPAPTSPGCRPAPCSRATSTS